MQSLERAQQSAAAFKAAEKEKHQVSSTEESNTTDTTNKSNKQKLKRNLSFREKKPDGIIGKLTFTSQIRMKALLMKNLLQLIRQPS